MTPAKETVLEFILPYPPSANRYWRNVKGRMVVSEAARAYKEEVGWMVKGKVKDPLSGKIYVRVKIFRPRKSGDLDNYLKVLLDSLKGLAYFDDKQIVEIRANLFDDKANPRAEVMVAGRVEPAPSTGRIRECDVAEICRYKDRVRKGRVK